MVTRRERERTLLFRFPEWSFRLPERPLRRMYMEHWACYRASCNCSYAEDGPTRSAASGRNREVDITVRAGAVRRLRAAQVIKMMAIGVMAADAAAHRRTMRPASFILGTHAESAAAISAEA